MKNLVGIIKLLFDDVKRGKESREKIKMKEKKHSESSQVKEAELQSFSNMVRPSSRARSDSLSEEAKDRLIEEMVKEGVKMDGATDADKQKVFLAEQARKAVQAKAIAQSSSSA